VSVALIGLVAQLAVTAVAPDTVSMDEMATIRVRVASESPRVVRVDAPSFRPFALLRSEATRHMETSPSGGVRVVTEYRYSLAPNRPGRFTIAPFTARLGRVTARTSSLTIVVRRSSRGSTVPEIVARARLDSTNQVQFRALVLPETLYVGQQATYQLGVFLEESVRDRLRRMEAIAPEMRGMLAYDPPNPGTGFPGPRIGNRRFEAHVYQRAIFPLESGRIVIPPARLVYALPLSYSFFSREESFELRSDSVVVQVIEPPLDTRPPDYTGVVGQVDVAARVDSAPVRVGDPLALTVRVSGTGNVKLFRRPSLSVAWASAVEADERVTLARDALHIRGAKEFDWVLTPRRAGDVVLPPIRYAYFDPDAGEYRVAATQPETLHVAPGALAESDTSATPNRLAIRNHYRGELAEPLYRHDGFWLLLAAMPVPAALILVTRRPRRPRRSAPAARALDRLVRQRGAADVRAVRQAFLAAVSERIETPLLDIAEPARLERVLRLSGVTDETAAEVRALLERLTASAFARDRAHAADAAEPAHRAYRRIDREARARRPRSSATANVVLLLVAAALSATALHATGESPGSEQFASAVLAYERGRYAEATERFSEVTLLAPRAPDAWANLGTAAWAASDTARAALGWQRALRLEPLASDVRDRLSLLSGASQGAASVPPVPMLPVALLAAALWAAGWLVLAWRGWRRRPGGARLAVWLVSGAAVVGAIAAGLDDRLAARDLAVVGHGAPLHTLPVLSSERGASVFTGEVARVTERRGGWTHVRAGGDREGWLESADLLSLARD
jgi:hypothetical protein